MPSQSVMTGSVSGSARGSRQLSMMEKFEKQKQRYAKLLQPIRGSFPQTNSNSAENSTLAIEPQSILSNKVVSPQGYSSTVNNYLGYIK